MSPHVKQWVLALSLSAVKRCGSPTSAREQSKIMPPAMKKIEKKKPLDAAKAKKGGQVLAKANKGLGNAEISKCLQRVAGRTTSSAMTGKRSSSGDELLANVASGHVSGAFFKTGVMQMITKANDEKHASGKAPAGKKDNQSHKPKKIDAMGQPVSMQAFRSNPQTEHTVDGMGNPLGVSSIKWPSFW